MDLLRQPRLILLVCLACLLSGYTAHAASAPVSGYRVIARYPHSTANYTEGFFYREGLFYEAQAWSGAPPYSSLSRRRVR